MSGDDAATDAAAPFDVRGKSQAQLRADWHGQEFPDGGTLYSETSFDRPVVEPVNAAAAGAAGALVGMVVPFAVGFAFRGLDLVAGESVAIGTHWLWHLCGAVGTHRLLGLYVLAVRLSGDADHQYDSGRSFLPPERSVRTR